MQYAFKNGSFIKTILDPHKCIESLEYTITEMEETNKKLREMNDELREEYYKDNTIAALKKELDWYYHHSFVISEEEDEGVKNWINNHGCKGYTSTKYVFIPSCVGSVGEVICGKCGKSFEFRSL